MVLMELLNNASDGVKTVVITNCSLALGKDDTSSSVMSVSVMSVTVVGVINTLFNRTEDDNSMSIMADVGREISNIVVSISS